LTKPHIGGKEKNKHWDKRLHAGRGRGAVGKTTVIGGISRKGNVVCQMIEQADVKTPNGFVRKAVAGNVDFVSTDENPGYHYLSAGGFPHQTITHSEGEYVRWHGSHKLD
jgi:hypothetical protein